MKYNKDFEKFRIEKIEISHEDITKFFNPYNCWDYYERCIKITGIIPEITENKIVVIHDIRQILILMHQLSEVYTSLQLPEHATKTYSPILKEIKEKFESYDIFYDAVYSVRMAEIRG